MSQLTRQESSTRDMFEGKKPLFSIGKGQGSARACRTGAIVRPSLRNTDFHGKTQEPGKLRKKELSEVTTLVPGFLLAIFKPQTSAGVHVKGRQDFLQLYYLFGPCPNTLNT